VVNERERDALRQIAPGARVDVVRNGVDVSALRSPHPPSTDRVVIFCGVMNYDPNVEGAAWLARDVWPLVRRAHPEARLQLAGSDPSLAVRDLHNPAMGIEVTGAVPDVRPYLWKAAVAAAPIHTSRGVQNKVLEAAAAGLPVVVTPAVMEGLPAEVKPACAVAGTPADFAARINEWFDSPPDARRAVAESARLESLGWQRQLAPLRAMLETVTRTA
jgi:glycosyltransferase involved in cell wall biosynthesis